MTDPRKLLPHVGHSIECVTYGSPAVNVSIECIDCNEVLTDADTGAEAGYCRFCHKPAGPNYHLVTSINPDSNPICCDDCWDERLR